MNETFEAPDIFGVDPVVQKLEDTLANKIGKESALFLPTGSVGNLVCILAHCSDENKNILVGDRSHMQLYEHETIKKV